MLTNLLQVGQRWCLAFHQGAHATQCSTLELFAAIQRVTILEQTKIILSDLVDKVASCMELTQGQFVMVLVVQHVHKVGIKGMNVIDLGELIQNIGQTIVPIALGELHFAHIKLTDALNGPACKK